MKPHASVLYLLLFILFPIYPAKAEHQNSNVLETYFSQTSAVEQKNFWNLHSGKIQNGLKKEYELQEVLSCEFIDLIKRNELPYLTVSDLSDLHKLTMFRFNDRIALALHSESPIFTHTAEEFEECNNRFLVEILCQEKEFKYFICFSAQHEIIVKSAFILENGNWKKLK